MPEDPMSGNRMPEDTVERLFGKLARAPLPVPAASAVVARGRQRRRRVRIGASASVAVVVAAAALGAHQIASLGAGRSHVVSPVSSSPSPTVSRSSAPGLPPAGSGPLILRVDASSRIVMSRVGSTAAPVPVPGLPDVANFFSSHIATNPAGGWVVTYPTGAVSPDGDQPSRLAIVTVSGAIRPFGPAFGRNEAVLSIAVSPDGSRLALAISTESSVRAVLDSSAVIMVIPMPGHHGASRTWRFTRGEVNWAKDLSWAPGGQDLTYAAGLQTGAGIDGNPVTLDTAAAGQAAPVATGWPIGKGGQQCHPDAGGWLGDTGRFAAVEECDSAHSVVFQPADESTGTPTGPAVTLPGQRPGCVNAMIDSSPDGRQILIGYCDALFLDSDGTITSLPGSPDGEAAWAGFGISQSQS